MKTGIDISEKLYEILNVSTVTSVIDGDIYRDSKPTDSELQDIVLLSLTTEGDEDVQNGLFVINIYCKNLQYGMPNETKLREIANAVLIVLDAYVQTGTNYFDISIINENTMQDVNQAIMSYTSIRINCMIQRDP